MIQRLGDCSRGHCRLLLSPNQPASWRDTQWAFALISIPPLSLAVALALVGMWPILPITGLELLLLYVALYLSALRQHRRQQLAITPDTLVIRSGRGSRMQEIRMPRAWASVSIEQGPCAWYPHRIFLIAYGNKTEVGAELTEQEKEELLDSLRASGLPVKSCC